MSTSVKATANMHSRGKALAVIAIYALFAIFSMIMAIYDIATDKVLFGILFAVAAFIFISLMLLKVNSAFGTYIRIKGNSLQMKSWVNDFLPYDITGGLITELKPAKTKITEIPIDEISAVFVGSKDFLKRNAAEAGRRLVKALYPYEHSAKKSKNAMISSLDLFYIETVDNDCCFMCVEGYSPADVVEIIGTLYEYNSDIYVKVNSREYKRHIQKLQQRFER